MPIRAAVLADLEALLALERSVENAPHWSEASWRDALASPPADGERDVTALQRTVLVAEMAESIVGFIALQLVAGVAEIESVAISTRHRRSGIARALCRAGMAWATDHAAQAIELEVRVSNEAAIALYVGLGFAEQGRRPGYYCEPLEDAILMARPL